MFFCIFVCAGEYHTRLDLPVSEATSKATQMTEPTYFQKRTHHLEAGRRGGGGVGHGSQTVVVKHPPGYDTYRYLDMEPRKVNEVCKLLLILIMLK